MFVNMKMRHYSQYSAIVGSTRFVVINCDKKDSNMDSSVENDDMTSNEWVCTETRGDRIEFQWTIKNFHQLPQENGKGIFSPFFPDKSTKPWMIEICPRGVKQEGADWISVYLYALTDKMNGIEVEYEITVFRMKEALITVGCMNKFDKMLGNGFPRLIRRSMLSVEDNPTEEITIHCKIEILAARTTMSSDQKSSDKAVTLGGWNVGLSKDFKALYENPTFTDFTIISGDKKFQVHKVILASRSPVFAEILDPEEMGDQAENEMTIEDIEPGVMEKLLEFIYTDAVSEIGELSRDLLIAADEYELKGLKNLCERTLRQSLNENNAAELLAFAYYRRAVSLTGCIMAFIADHPEILESESLKVRGVPQELCEEIIRIRELKENKYRVD